jgi:Aldehyde dehydrogenase family/D-isomer specific 2-hydroxyacid dehydrogenase, NAD binding domain
MMILALVRNYIPSHDWARKGGWNIADCVERSYDVEGMQVGTVAAGRIGLAVLRRLKPFDVGLHYTDRHRLPDTVEKELQLTWHPTAESLARVCDVVTINAPLHPETQNLFDAAMLSKMKRGAYLVNTAPPTVFADVKDDMRIAQEEIFGLVISAIPFTDIDEVIERSNKTHFGLGAGVWTRDVGKAHRLARGIRAGSVWINCYQAADPAVPFGGYKMSGYGRERGKQHVEENLNVKSVWIKTD